jgi:hypothetical protein
MPWMGLEPTIAAAEGAKTVHVLDRSATVAGGGNLRAHEYLNTEISYVNQK